MLVLSPTYTQALRTLYTLLQLLPINQSGPNGRFIIYSMLVLSLTLCWCYHQHIQTDKKSLPITLTLSHQSERSKQPCYYCVNYPAFKNPVHFTSTSSHQSKRSKRPFYYLLYVGIITYSMLVLSPTYTNR
jgi:hypothetical protein